MVGRCLVASILSGGNNGQRTHAPGGARRHGRGTHEHGRRDECAGADPDEREDLRPRARRLARRLVLAARVRPAGKARAQGVHADHDGIGRALAPDRSQGQPRHPRHRHRQRDQVGGARRHRAGRSFLRRRHHLGRGRAGGRQDRITRVPRRLRAGERRQPGGQGLAAGAGSDRGAGGERRDRDEAGAGRGVPGEREGPCPGSMPCARRTRSRR
jgi:hypothetical protein